MTGVIRGLCCSASGFWGGLMILVCLPAPALGAGHAVVLQYHHFGSDAPPSTSVTLGQFERHLNYLKNNDFTVLPLEQIVSSLREGKELPDKCVAITIDDAYISVFERAYPKLREAGVPFTVFVPTEGVDRKFRSYMTWEQMREMQKGGATFGSHGHSHASLVRRLSGESEEEWKDRVKEDITHSLGRLREELSTTSGLFAYPYGEYDNALRDIVAGMDLAGFAQQSGALWEGSDFAALPRFPMAASYAEMENFSEKVLSLPLPVLSAEPDDPVLKENETIPVLRLKLAPGNYQFETLACFASGQGQIGTNWIDRAEGIVEITAHDPLPIGRSRYNCTARHSEEGRYYWYSHMWIRGGMELPARAP